MGFPEKEEMKYIVVRDGTVLLIASDEATAKRYIAKAENNSNECTIRTVEDDAAEALEREGRIDD